MVCPGAATVHPSDCRLVVLGFAIGGLVVLLSRCVLHSALRLAAAPLDMCSVFNDMEGEVACQSASIAAYSFGWANSDCAGILPLVVIRPKTVHDIARAAKIGTSLGIPLSYRSGGHSYTCDGIKPGSVHIDLRSMRRKRLFRQDGAWLVEFETGNTFRDLFEIIDRKRFSIVHGACHAVGVGGFYLHGGVHLNSLTALYGWGNESVVNMSVVTAAGEQLALSPASHHQDLWRAMLRSGSDFGIAATMTVKVYEQPEPLTWLFWARMSHAGAAQVFLRALKDPDVQLNPYFVNPPVFQAPGNRSETFTLQFSLLRGPSDYQENLRQSVAWFRKNMRPLSRWTVAFNAVVPKPDDVTSLGYPSSWVSSHAIWPASSACTTAAMRMLLAQQAKMIRRTFTYTFARLGCWLTFARLPGERVFYEFSCPNEQVYSDLLEEVEGLFAGICPSFVKYRNTPHRSAPAYRYFPDHGELMRAKVKWDPGFLLGPATMSLRDLRGAPADDGAATGSLDASSTPDAQA